jgi:hypothetical protein
MAAQPQEIIDTPAVIDAVEQDNDQQTERDFDAEARAHGWTPKEEFRGDPSRWVDAETFIKRADEVMPLLKKKTQNQDRKIAELEKLVKRLTKAEQTAYESALKDLKAQQREAAAVGDTDAYDRIDGQLEDLRKNTEADVAHGEDPAAEYEAFREANAWYDKANLASASEMEIEARLYADRLADRWAKEGKTQEMAPSEFFNRLAAEVEQRFPLLKAKKPRVKPDNPVAGVTNNRADRNAKTGANLPPDAKRQAERFWNQGVIKGKDLTEALNNYAKNYDWSPA